MSPRLPPLGSVLLNDIVLQRDSRYMTKLNFFHCASLQPTEMARSWYSPHLPYIKRPSSVQLTPERSIGAVELTVCTAFALSPLIPHVEMPMTVKTSAIPMIHVLRFFIVLPLICTNMFCTTGQIRTHG